MARTATYQQAINEALAQEMERDETVIIMGEDVAGGLGTDGERDAWGGPLGITKGLYGKFGDRSWTPRSASPPSSAPRSAQQPQVSARSRS